MCFTSTEYATNNVLHKFMVAAEIIFFYPKNPAIMVQTIQNLSWGHHYRFLSLITYSLIDSNSYV